VAHDSSAFWRLEWDGKIILIPILAAVVGVVAPSASLARPEHSAFAAEIATPIPEMVFVVPDRVVDLEHDDPYGLTLIGRPAPAFAAVATTAPSAQFYGLLSD